MTKEEKIDILKKMLWLNFKENFGRYGICTGLCFIYELATNYSIHDVRDTIPELIKHRTTYQNPFWWPYRGRFKPWWERHKAIRKTIKHLKKS